MAQNQSLRLSILSESNPLGSKRRFGLFSQPISTAVGDDGAFRSKIHPRNEQGKPVTELRNIFVSPLKTGRGRSAYFGPLNSLADHERKDIFMEQGVRLLKEQHQSFTTGRKETNFYPIAGIKPITNSAYPFIPQNNPQLNPKRFKMEDGRVKSGPKNFYTNPQTKINDSTFRHYKYIQDPFERKHSKDIEDMKKWKARQGENVFIPNNFAPQLLNSNKEVYGLDREIIQPPLKEPNLSILHHQAPWSPASCIKEGLNGYFTPVSYVENPPQLKKRRQSQMKQGKEAFKGMGAVLTSPTPSVSLNKVNIMKSIHFSPKK